MCGSILFGFLFGIVLSKIARRAYWRFHGGGGGCGGGSCGSGFRGRYRSFGYGHGGPWGHGHGGSFRAWGVAGFSPYSDGGPGAEAQGQTDYNAAGKSGKTVDELFGGLELSQRQRAEAAPVLVLVKGVFGSRGATVETVLASLQSETFDAAAIERGIAGRPLPNGVRQELFEGLEHLHTILITEQRQALKTALSGEKPAAAPQS